jgi:hypothetical protein
MTIQQDTTKIQEADDLSKGRSKQMNVFLHEIIHW